MGLLDEAIREHLDLKRRRGADPDEIERAEREALGPVRRQPEQPDPEQANGTEPDQEQDAGLDGLHPPVASEEPSEHFVADADFAPVVDEDRTAGFGTEPDLGAEPLESPLPVSAEPPAPPRSPGPETAEYDVEQEHLEEEHREAEHLEAPGEEPHPDQKAGEDPLEETPEFLQDTPEHDRLWFEQRPPKDFNFEE
jgi:hypothetical protein